MRHFNPSISEDKHRLLNLKSGDDTAEVNEIIQPTIEIKPRLNIVKTATSGTIYTTPTDKDFYLTNAFVSASHTAVDTGTTNGITLYIEGVQVTIVSIRSVNATGVAESGLTCIENYQFHPIKVDRGTAISTSATGTWSSSIYGIKGFTRETIKGV